MRDPLRVAAVHKTGLLDTPAERAFDRFTRLAARILGAPAAFVTLVDGERVFFKSAIGIDESCRGVPIADSFCPYAVATGERLIVRDARVHPHFCDHSAIRDFGLVAYAGIPLVTPQGHALGTFCVIDTKPRAWSEDEVELLADLGAAVMTEIELRQRIETHVHDQARLAESEAALRTTNATLTQNVAARTSELTALNRHLLRIAEEERSRLARELHDELGANLSAAMMDISRVNTKLAGLAPELARQTERALQALTATMQLGRRIVADLRPALLRDFGLTAALGAYCASFSEASGLACEAELQDDLPPLREEAALALYRVVQESLTNVRRYAQAERVWVRLAADTHALTLSVTDDGTGIDEAALAKPRSHGILGMRERVEALGGSFRIALGAEGRGTIVKVVAPIADLAA